MLQRLVIIQWACFYENEILKLYYNLNNLSRPGARMSWMATYSFLACGPRDQVISACGSHDFLISEWQQLRGHEFKADWHYDSSIEGVPFNTKALHMKFDRGGLFLDVYRNGNSIPVSQTLAGYKKTSVNRKRPLSKADTLFLVLKIGLSRSHDDQL